VVSGQDGLTTPATVAVVGVVLKALKKANPTPDDELLPEYDLNSLRVRSFGPARVAPPRHGVVLEDDAAAVFPDSASVNEALRFLIRSRQGAAPDRPRGGK
jgi:hypothetical protein